MNALNRNALALLGLLVAVLTVTVPAEARVSTSGWRPSHVASRHHAFAPRHHAHRHVAHRHRARFHTARHHHAHARSRLARGGGNASWYGAELAGRRTASGERFNPNGLTAAHRSLPFGTRVLVTNNATGRSVVVRINDRGPFAGGRSIDLARGAARAIGMGGSSYVSMSVVR